VSVLNEAVSVIIPTYNRYPTVCRAIDSVLGQTHTPTACIVVDDASADDTVKRLRQTYASRITLLVNDSNKDKSFSRNLGARYAQSEFICFLDSDDALPPDSIEKRLSVFTQDRFFNGVAFGSRKNAGKAQVSSAALPQTLTISDYCRNKEILSTNSVLMRRELFLKCGLFDESLSNREDVELFLRLLSELEFRSCASVAAIVYNDADHRARNDFLRIIRQGRTFSSRIKANTQLTGPHEHLVQALVREEQGEFLRALYYLKDYKAYVAEYEQGEKKRENPVAAKFFKRYWLAKIRLLLGVS